MRLDRVARVVTPPVVWTGFNAIRRRLSSLWKPHSYGWFGDYSSWEEASTHVTGYETQEILEKALAAELRVHRGAAAFERDTVAFALPDHSWPTLAALMYCAAASGGNLRVVDFGGGLGSTWSQYRDLWLALPEVRWCIVELPSYVKMGKDLLQDNNLSFHDTIEEAQSHSHASVFFSSSVLQYLCKPYEFLADVAARDFEFICLDRIGCSLDGRDRLTVQRVDPVIYDASYPCWFLSQERIRMVVGSKFECQFQFDTADQSNVPSLFRGFLFRRKHPLCRR